MHACDFIVMTNFDRKQISSVHLGKHFIYKHLLGTVLHAKFISITLLNPSREDSL